jgi:quercetin dioxygenase-like cupin family protein
VSGQFLPRAEREDELYEGFAEIDWVSRPELTGARHVIVMDSVLAAGAGHDFHRHPEQEEVIWVREGRLVQWIEQERRELGPGDACFIGADTVHALFNETGEPATMTAVLGPCVGETGVELVDVSAEEPWASLRGRDGS